MKRTMILLALLAALMGGAPPPTSGNAATAAGGQRVSGYRYTRELRMLTADMGFDEETAKLALEQTNGDVDAAVNLIAEWTDDG